MRKSTVFTTVTMTIVGALGLAACGPDGGGGGDTDSFPEDNITVIVPFAAGGPTDTVTRLLADPLGADLGVQVVVQNVEGAGGTVGAAEAAAADPDGYTLLVHHIGMSTAPSLYPDLPYSPTEDFAPIGLVTDVPMTIVTRKSLGVASLDELFDYVRENEGAATYAHAGVGSASNLCGLLVEKYLGIDLQEVPYDGTAPAMADLVGEQVDFMCDQTTNTTGQITSGDVTAVAVTTPERVDILPDVPTTKEQDAAEIAVSVWHGLYAPKDTPPEVVERIDEALQVALRDDNVIEQMAALGTSPSLASDATPAALETRLVDQTELWAGLVTQG